MNIVRRSAVAAVTAALAIVFVASSAHAARVHFKGGEPTFIDEGLPLG